MHGVELSSFKEYATMPVVRKNEFFQTLFVGLIIALALPPTITLTRWVPQAPGLAARPVLSRAYTVLMAATAVMLLGFGVSKLGNFSPFLYFQF
jgi:alginate O-acetyltransferase complex protein AlgI